MGRLATGLREQGARALTAVVLAGVLATVAAVLLASTNVAVTRQQRLELVTSRVLGDLRLSVGAVVSAAAATATLASPASDPDDLAGDQESDQTGDQVDAADAADTPTTPTYAPAVLDEVSLERAVLRLSAGRGLSAIADGLQALALVAAEDPPTLRAAVPSGQTGVGPALVDELAGDALTRVLRQSSRGGVPALSSPVMDGGAVVVAVPIYSRAAALQSTTGADERVASLLGWVVAVVDPSELSRTAVQSAGESVRVTLTDVTDVDDADAALDGGQPFGSAGPEVADGAERTVLLNVTSRTWRVQTTAAGLLSPAEQRLPWLVGIVGLLLTAAALALVSLLVTQRQRALQQVEEATRELRRSNELLQDFAGVVAHDLKAPLTVLRAVPKMIRKVAGDDLPPESERMLGLQEESVQRMRDLIDGLLAWSRVGGAELEVEDLDLTSLVRAQADQAIDAARAAGRAATIEVQPLPQVTGDRVLLGQVFGNLLGNACKFVADDVDPHIRVSAESVSGVAGAVLVHVDDNGVGIPPGERGEVQEAFRRGSRTREQEGTGLGLAIVGRILAAHDADLVVEDSPLGGTRITLRLPAAIRTR